MAEHWKILFYNFYNISFLHATVLKVSPMIEGTVNPLSQCIRVRNTLVCCSVFSQCAVWQWHMPICYCHKGS